MIQKAASKRARRTERGGVRRFVLRVILRHIKPAIWREITVPDSYSLLQLHRCIQLVFGWLDYHLFEFQISGRKFEAPDPEAECERADLVRLRDLDLSSSASFLYVYDTGDYWEHEIGVRSMPRGRGPMRPTSAQTSSNGSVRVSTLHSSIYAPGITPSFWPQRGV